MSTDAVVVGAGPNGLTAAVVLARAGLAVTVLEAADRVGGGTRTAELTLPGLRHDLCSAVHPLGAASTVFADLGLQDHGLTWRHPELALAHPLDDGTAVELHRDLDATAAGLGADGTRWLRWFRGSAARWASIEHDLLRPLIRLPRHPVTVTSFGLRALASAARLASGLTGTRARALFGGLAGHAIQPLEAPMTAATALTLGAAGHRAGWPVAEGGSQAIADALVAALTDAGGRVETDTPVRSLHDLPRCRVALLDVTPRQAAAILGDRLPDRIRARFERWRHGPAAFKLDLAVEGGVPWVAPACRRAGTVHVGGSFEEIAASERAVAQGRVPERPFVLVAQQYLADPTRSAGDVHPVWAYCHVPNGWTGDATGVVEAQIERFAPGFRERIVARHAWTPAALQAHNPNYLGGDIAGGATGAWQLLARPRLAADPYATGVPGVWLCSSSTPPGPGVHGLCGYHAARAALRRL